MLAVRAPTPLDKAGIRQSGFHLHAQVLAGWLTADAGCLKINPPPQGGQRRREGREENQSMGTLPYVRLQSNSESGHCPFSCCPGKSRATLAKLNLVD